jgi:hypothetical protein
MGFSCGGWACLLLLLSWGRGCRLRLLGRHGSLRCPRRSYWLRGSLGLRIFLSWLMRFFRHASRWVFCLHSRSWVGYLRSLFGLRRWIWRSCGACWGRACGRWWGLGSFFGVGIRRLGFGICRLGRLLIFVLSIWWLYRLIFLMRLRPSMLCIGDLRVISM